MEEPIEVKEEPISSEDDDDLKPPLEVCVNTEYGDDVELQPPVEVYLKTECCGVPEPRVISGDGATDADPLQFPGHSGALRETPPTTGHVEPDSGGESLGRADKTKKRRKLCKSLVKQDKAELGNLHEKLLKLPNNSFTKPTAHTRPKSIRQTKLLATLKGFDLVCTSLHRTRAQARNEHNALQRSVVKMPKQPLHVLEKEVAMLPNINDRSNWLVNEDVDTQIQQQGQSEIETARLPANSIRFTGNETERSSYNQHSPPSDSNKSFPELPSQMQFSMFEPSCSNTSTQLDAMPRPQDLPSSHFHVNTVLTPFTQSNQEHCNINSALESPNHSSLAMSCAPPVPTTSYSPVIPPHGSNQQCQPTANHSVEASLREQIHQLQTELTAARMELARRPQDTSPCGNLCSLNRLMLTRLESLLQRSSTKNTLHSASEQLIRAPDQLKIQQPETLVELAPGSDLFIAESVLSMIRLDGKGNPRQLVRLLLSHLYQDKLRNMSANGQGRHSAIPAKVLMALLTFVNKEKSKEFTALVKSEFIDTVNKKCGTVRRKFARMGDGSTNSSSSAGSLLCSTRDSAINLTQEEEFHTSQVSDENDFDSNGPNTDLWSHKDLSETDDDITF